MLSPSYGKYNFAVSKQEGEIIVEKQKLAALIGENVKACRLSVGMTQAQLAEAAEISTPFVSNIESGQKMVSVLTLLALSDALRVSSDALLRKDVRLNHEDAISTLLRGLPTDYLHKLGVLTPFEKHNLYLAA